VTGPLAAPPELSFAERDRRWRAVRALMRERGLGCLLVAGQENLARALNLPDIREQIVASGAEVGGRPPEEFAAFVRAEIAKWGKVIKDAGIRLD